MSNQKVFKIISITLAFTILLVFKEKTLNSLSLSFGWWSYSEILINYPDQFVRRGLLGEIIYLLSQNSGSIKIVNNFIFFNFTLFVTLLMYTFRRYDLSYKFIFLYFVFPLGILHMVVFDNFYHRKDLIYLNLFLIMLNLLITHPEKNKELKFIILLFTTVFLGLIHEGLLLLFIPIYIFFIEKYFFKKKLFYISYKNIFLILNLVLFTISSIFKGNKQLAENIWNSLHISDKRLISENINDFEFNGIGAIGWSFLEPLNLFYQVLNSGAIFYWVFSFLLIIYFYNAVFFGNDFKLFQFKVTNSNLINKFYLLYVPILVVGWDWGRWIMIFFYSFTFILLESLNKEDIKNLYLSRKHFYFILLLSFLTVIPEYNISEINYNIFEQYYKFLVDFKNIFL